MRAWGFLPRFASSPPGCAEKLLLDPTTGCKLGLAEDIETDTRRLLLLEKTSNPLGGGWPRMPEELETTWEGIRAQLRSRVPDITFHLWLEPLRLVGRERGSLCVRAPAHIRTLVAERYLDLVREAAQAELGRSATIRLVDDGWRPPDVAATPAGQPAGSSSVRLNPKYTFDQFVIGDENRLPHAAALAVAELPSQAYNPLFIHGPPGLGKTHLLHAIGNYVASHGQGITVRYATVEDFTNEFVKSLKGGSVEAFKGAFRRIDVLLIDDVQFLADKSRTREEFFHTFNALYECGGQLVLTSDRPPLELAELEARLTERFACGLVAELSPPSAQVRLAILRKRARLDSLLDVDDETLGEVASQVLTSVRALEGALIRVVAQASLAGQRPTPEFARRVLDRDCRSSRRPPTIADVQASTAAALGIEPRGLIAHDRRPTLVVARQIAMYLARELTDESLPTIGHSFGDRNHSTVLHAHRKIAHSIKRDTALAHTVNALRQRLGGPLATGPSDTIDGAAQAYEHSETAS